MNSNSLYLLRYDEIGLKGGNRKFFENALVRHVRKVLDGCGQVQVNKIRGRILVEGELENFDKIEEQLQKVPGLSSFSRAERIDKNMDAWKDAVLALFRKLWDGKELVRFRITSKRSDKNYPLKSSDINAELGAHLVVNSPEGLLKVDLHQPEINIHLEVNQSGSMIFVSQKRGLGGLPVGTAGDVLCLLSGGIDSPVAAFQMMRRGCKVHYIFFENRVFLGRAAYDKVEKLAQKLSHYQFDVKLHIVPFSNIQVAIRDYCSERNRVVLYRRFMYRIAERIANKKRYLGLVNGESLGQVASQTLENIHAVNTVVNSCVYRPLICMDKIDITNIAKRIDTYETSIEDAPDCCSVFMPKRPATRAQIEKLEDDESKIDVEALENEAIDNMEVLIIE
ncbi:MAG: tRNA 4-thiouridine(8) synthase ThiI [Planctomycetes bacterium]|nr:tRNA 4-thiouridine(8) synthase ThiI [Planctomycetota bacterium]